MSAPLMLEKASLTQTIAAALGALFSDEPFEIEPHGPTFTRAVSVGIAGDVQAAVVVRTDEPVAIGYAASMFGLEGPSVSDIDVEDALLELANVLGGAAKSTLRADCALELPCAIAPTSGPLCAAGTNHEEVLFSVNGGVVAVGIFDTADTSGTPVGAARP